MSILITSLIVIVVITVKHLQLASGIEPRFEAVRLN